MGGVRQQFSTAAEVVLAQESIRFFESLGPPLLRPGRLPLRRDDRGRAGRPRGAARAPGRARRARQSAVDPRSVRGLYADDVLGAVACWSDGVADPPAVARELVRRAVELGRRAARGHGRAERRRRRARDRLRAALGRVADERGARAPVRPLCRQLLRHRSARPAGRLADDRRGRDRVPLPPARRPARARDGRPGRCAGGSTRSSTRASSRTGSRGSRTATRRRPGDDRATRGRASTT